MLMYRCLNGIASRYLTELAMPVCDTACHRLRSASSTDLVVPATRRSTNGDRTFAVAGPTAWNSLPPAVRSVSYTTPSKKTLNLTFLDYLIHCNMCILTMYSTLVVVYTAYCTLQIVRLTLHYITSYSCRQESWDYSSYPCLCVCVSVYLLSVCSHNRTKMA